MFYKQGNLDLIISKPVSAKLIDAFDILDNESDKIKKEDAKYKKGPQ